MKKIYHIFYILILELAPTGCKKLIEINPPQNALVSTNVYRDDETAASVVNGIYSSFYAPLGNFIPFNAINTGLLSDELTNYAVGEPDYPLYYKNELTSTLTYDNWNLLYSQIYVCNVAIEGILASQTLSDNAKKQLIGQAKFLRAYFYFDLVNLWGDVPLLLSSDYKINSAASRTVVVDVYKQIVEDLVDAESSLSEDYLNADLTPTTERIRPNKSAAAALLARVYLYLNDWQDAEIQSSLVINNSRYSLSSDLNQVFLANSSEAIWQIKPLQTSINTWEGYRFILTTSVGTATRPAAISDSLLFAFEPGDLRKFNWIKSVIINGSTYSFPYKYKVRTSSVLTEYSMILRLSEQYLIRAEARAKQGNLDGANSDVNFIRARAGLADVNTSTPNEALDAIMHERRVELFTEGHRWYDLRRTGRLDSVMTVITPIKGGSWNSNDQLLPIPLSEIKLNSHLVQNPGYE